ncbi:MAG: hypothetical protein HY645_13535 [Acidobacteria bacterium]|nr:hypothetical protein [Acidobacteriota bacterium]
MAKSQTSPCLWLSVEAGIRKLVSRCPEVRQLFHGFRLQGCKKIRDIPCGAEEKEQLLRQLVEMVKQNGAYRFRRIPKRGARRAGLDPCGRSPKIFRPRST